MSAGNEDFIFNAVEINSCISNMKDAKQKIEDAYYKICRCSMKIDSDNNVWQGESKNTMTAYLELCKEFHKYFVDSEVLQGGERDNAVKEAINALDEAYKNSIDFYSKNENYKYLENL